MDFSTLIGFVLLQDAIYFAYFPPYSYVRHQELIARTHAKKNVRLEVIGETLDGYDLDVLRIGESALLCCAALLTSWLESKMPNMLTLLLSWIVGSCFPHLCCCV